MNRFLAASLLILATCADGGCGRTTPPTAVPKAAQPHGLRIRFTEDGSVHPSTPASVQKIADTASEPGVTDVFIFSHGW